MSKIKQFLNNFDQLFTAITALFVAFWILRSLPIDDVTFIRLIFLMTSLMFAAAAVYFFGLMIQLRRANKKSPFALKSLTVLSLLGLTSTTLALVENTNPSYGLGVVFMYGGVFLYTAVRGNH